MEGLIYDVFPIPRKSISVHRLVVHLRDVQPNFGICRRILVPSDSSFYELHCVIQRTMMWEGKHRYAFSSRDETGRKKYIGKKCFVKPKEDSAVVFIDEDEAKICDHLKKVGDTFCYTYNFTKFWIHKVEVEGIGRGHPETLYPICVAGRYAGPPEDSNPKDLRPNEWPYDFTKFDPEAAMLRTWYDSMRYYQRSPLSFEELFPPQRSQEVAEIPAEEPKEN